MCVCVDHFFPIPLEILSLFKQSQGLNMDRMNNWWFGFVVHNHLEWPNSHLVRHPAGVTVIAFQSLGTCGLMTTAGPVFRPRSQASPLLLDWEELMDLGSYMSQKTRLTLGSIVSACCSNGATNLGVETEDHKEMVDLYHLGNAWLEPAGCPEISPVMSYSLPKSLYRLLIIF